MNQTVSENSNLLDKSIGINEDLSDVNAAIGVYATFLRSKMADFDDRLLQWLTARLIKSGRSPAYVNRLSGAHPEIDRKCRLLKQFLSAEDLKKLETKLAEEWGKLAPVNTTPIHLE